MRIRFRVRVMVRISTFMLPVNHVTVPTQNINMPAAKRIIICTICTRDRVTARVMARVMARAMSAAAAARRQREG